MLNAREASPISAVMLNGWEVSPISAVMLNGWEASPFCRVFLYSREILRFAQNDRKAQDDKTKAIAIFTYPRKERGRVRTKAAYDGGRLSFLHALVSLKNE